MVILLSNIELNKMKKILLLVALISTVIIQKSTAQDAAKENQFSQLLTSYYNIKNALVSSNAATASAQAGDLVKAINDIDMKAMSEAEHTAFMDIQEKLAADAKAIAASDKIEAQRTSFSSLSDNIYALAKRVKLSAEPVYQQFCPMKKMYWLSSEAAIKNPYYGKMMLTCGKVTDTLK